MMNRILHPLRIAFLIAFTVTFFSKNSFSQSDDEPITWESSVEQNGDQAILKITAKLQKGWHLYSQHLPSDDGPVATEFTFTKDSLHYVLNGKVEESKFVTEFDPNFEMDLNYFLNKAVFTQKINILSKEPFTIIGSIYSMVCNDVMCMPPSEKPLSFGINGGVAMVNEADGPKVKEGLFPSLPNIDLQNPVNDCGIASGDDNGNKTLLTLFILGFLGGLFALLTPCVFPMIPLTVSYFTKNESTKRKGIINAILYGFFIFFIYALLSLPFHFGSDPEVLNEIATSIWLNIGFFVIFVVFAISFLGYFEITLPSSWTNKADTASNIGGVLGIFFMALTLALVSFSCTGPILGSVLAGSLKNGPWPITAAMCGFGLALGLPFAIFAMFPSWLNSLPKSGGWLNTVKVFLGFVELGLALKFLSNADLVRQWGLLQRETFFLIWFILSLLLTLYLFGLIRFPHDGLRKRAKGFRLIIAIITLGFTVYLVPGFTGTNWWGSNLLSGFPPPTFYSWHQQEDREVFTDFQEAVNYANEVNKPILIDFTGWACVNCRKMEENVWPDKKIKELMSKYVIVSLYVDDKNLLPDSLQGIAKIKYDNGKIKKKSIKSVGNKWATFETLSFHAVSQPRYVLLSPSGYLLNHPVGYTPDISTYAKFLQCGLDALIKLENGDYSLHSGEITPVIAEEDNSMPDPVHWKFGCEPIRKNEYELSFTASIEKNWHVYAVTLPSDDGPVATSFTFDKGDYTLNGEIIENNFITEYDPNFGMDLNYFEDQAIFKQKITAEQGTVLSGTLNYMSCNDKMCLPPEDIPFSITVK